MSDETMGQQDPASNPQFQFHPDYNTPKPGDVILRAGDNGTCFRFPLQTLATLSPFFADIPPALAPSDTYDGCPLLTLHDTTSRGIHLFLNLIRNLTSPFALQQMNDTESIIDAAIVGKMFLVPLVGRLLVEALHDETNLNDSKEFIEFAIWAINGEVRSKLVQAAEATISSEITLIDRYISHALKQHSPVEWEKLQDLHLRHEASVRLFRKKLPRFSFDDGPDSVDIFYHESHLSDRVSEYGTLQPEPDLRAIWDHLYEAKPAEEIIDFYERKDCGLTCERCISILRQHFGETLDWMGEFALKYEPNEALRMW